MTDQDPLATVHDAMVDAVQSPNEDEGPMMNFSFRIHSSVREKADAVCRSNGTTFAKWLRSCCEVLIKDYAP